MKPGPALLATTVFVAGFLTSASSCSHQNEPAAPASTAAAGERENRPEAAAEALPEKPSQSDVLDALKAAEPTVLACAGYETGAAKVKVVVAGPTGTVTSAKVIGGDFAGTPEGACMEKALVGAAFPKFTQAELTVTYPYNIK
jgi:hypothetical protein